MPRRKRGEEEGEYEDFSDDSVGEEESFEEEILEEILEKVAPRGLSEKYYIAVQNENVNVLKQVINSIRNADDTDNDPHLKVLRIFSKEMLLAFPRWCINVADALVNNNYNELYNLYRDIYEKIDSKINTPKEKMTVEAMYEFLKQIYNNDALRPEAETFRHIHPVVYETLKNVPYIVYDNYTGVLIEYIEAYKRKEYTRMNSIEEKYINAGSLLPTLRSIRFPSLSDYINYVGKYRYITHNIKSMNNIKTSVHVRNTIVNLEKKKSELSIKNGLFVIRPEILGITADNKIYLSLLELVLLNSDRFSNDVRDELRKTDGSIDFDKLIDVRDELRKTDGSIDFDKLIDVKDVSEIFKGNKETAYRTANEFVRNAINSKLNRNVSEQKYLELNSDISYEVFKGEQGERDFYLSSYRNVGVPFRKKLLNYIEANLEEKGVTGIAMDFLLCFQKNPKLELIVTDIINFYNNTNYTLVKLITALSRVTRMIAEGEHTVNKYMYTHNRGSKVRLIENTSNDRGRLLDNTLKLIDESNDKRVSLNDRLCILRDKRRGLPKNDKKLEKEYDDRIKELERLRLENDNDTLGVVDYVSYIKKNLGEKMNRASTRAEIEQLKFMSSELNHPKYTLEVQHPLYTGRKERSDYIRHLLQGGDSRLGGSGLVEKYVSVDPVVYGVRQFRTAKAYILHKRYQYKRLISMEDTELVEAMDRMNIGENVDAIVEMVAHLDVSDVLRIPLTFSNIDEVVRLSRVDNSTKADFRKKLETLSQLGKEIKYLERIHDVINRRNVSKGVFITLTKIRNILTENRPFLDAKATAYLDCVEGAINELSVKNLDSSKLSRLIKKCSPDEAFYIIPKTSYKNFVEGVKCYSQPKIDAISRINNIDIYMEFMDFIKNRRGAMDEMRLVFR